MNVERTRIGSSKAHFIESVSVLSCRAVSVWQCSYVVEFLFFLGRYEITEIPLPSSVIDQINKNNIQATLNPGQVTPTGVPTSATKNVQLPQVPRPGEREIT